MSSSPIADLSYRNYDGPLNENSFRPWVVARNLMTLGIKKKGFWVWAVLSAYWYFILAAVFYVATSVIPVIAPNAENPFFRAFNWTGQFVNGFSISQIMLFTVALTVGIGTVANDNRTNALLVYLSKPLTKRDYLLGKWLGVFTIIALVVAVPTYVFYLYSLLSYSDKGIFSQDPWLPLRLLALPVVAGSVHASMCVGIGSLCDKGRTSGAIYAGVYFLTLFLTVSVKGMLALANMQGADVPSALRDLYYCSIDGVQIGMAKLALISNGTPLFPGPRGDFTPGRPSAWFQILVYLAVVILPMLVAWRRVRAVEVVAA